MRLIAILLFAFAAAAQTFNPQETFRNAREHAAAGEKEKAIAALQQLVANGYGNVPQLLAENDLLSVRTDARWNEIVAAARKNARPCTAGAEYRQLDYWLGEWDVEVNGQRTARSSIQLVLEECAVFENYSVVSGGYSGKSFSVWDAQEKRWEQHYVDTAGGGRMWIGGLQGDRMVFFLRGQGATPETVSRMSYVKDGPDRVRQLIEVSADNEKTWSKGWEGIYIRRK